MNRTIDLSQLSVPQLLEIRRILAGGVEATGEMATKAGTLARALREENSQLKKLNERRDMVEEANLDWDSDYWMSFDDKTFNFFLNLFVEKKRELALSEKTKTTMKIPPVFHAADVSGVELVRQGFNTLKSRRNGHED